MIFYRFVAFRQNHIAADFTNWYYPWRFYLVQDNNYNSYISNKNLGDPLFMFAPVDKTYNEQIKQGRIPLWNDSSLMGYPAYASHTASFFYPPKIIANYFFDFLDARDILAIFHLFLMASAMYFYLYGLGLSHTSSFIGGLVWMLCGFIACRVEFGTDIFPLAYLPLILWMTDQIFIRGGFRYAALLFVFTGFCFLSGHWQFVFYVMLLWGAYSLFRMLSLMKTEKKFPFKKMFLIIVSGILGFSLSAMQSLPIIELTGLSARPAASSLQEIFATSRLLPENLLTLFTSELFGNPVHHFYLTRISSGVQNYFELMIYIGILPLILATVGMMSKNSISSETRFFSSTALVVLLMALGTPLYNVLIFVFPFTKSFTPVRILCLFAFAMCVLAAAGFQQVLSHQSGKNLLIRLGMAFTGITLALTVFSIHIVQSENRIFTNLLELYWKSGVMDLPHNFADKKMFVYEMINRIKAHYNWSNIQLTAPVFIGACSTALLYVYHKYSLKPRLFTTLVVFIILFDLFPLGQRFNPAFPRESVYPPSQGIRIMTSDKDLFRVAGWQRYPHPNTLSVYGLNEINGYYSMFPVYVRDLFFTMNGGSLPSPILAVFEEKASISPGLAALFNIKWFYNNPGGPPPPHIQVKPVYNGDLAIYRNLNYLPRAFIVNKVESLSGDEISKRIFSESFDPAQAVLLSSEDIVINPQEMMNENNNKAEVEISEYCPGKAVIKVKSPIKSWLVMSDTWYPGWKAYQDGKPLEVYRAYNWARAVSIESGEHTVVFRFEPESLKTGIKISCTSVILILLLLGLDLLYKVKCREKQTEKSENEG